MARTVQTTQADQINAIIAALRTPKSNRSLLDRLTDVAVDTVADSTETLSRFAAAAMSATDSFGDGYELEKERQLRRRAERILKATQQ